ncbi:rhomboid family domain-containing protein [Ditylenchus destructor]|uniref:Rhomboid family domain-containing protein n=1 Tax=Ditylenchus destructor TaxID=166010 RepID=A0AAD4NCV7_9BILA|nr:rhomboid family domain-containing protein [Ditylenchus destructor]
MHESLKERSESKEPSTKASSPGDTSQKETQSRHITVAIVSSPNDEAADDTIISNEEKSQRPYLFKSVSSPGKSLNAIQQQKPPLNRTQSIKDKISLETAKFFGVTPSLTVTAAPDGTDENADVFITNSEEGQKWKQRRFRHLNKQYGIKKQLVNEELQQKVGIDALPEFWGGAVATPVTPYALDVPSPGGVSRARSLDGRLTVVSQRRPPIERRENVMQIAYNAFTSILQGHAFRRPKQRRVAELSSNTQQSKDPTARRQPSPIRSPCGTYMSIRERNVVSGSFPSNRLHNMSFGIAQPIQTVRKISGILSGSSTTVASKGKATETEKSTIYSERQSFHVEEKPAQNLSKEREKEPVSVTKAASFPASRRSKPKLRRTYGIIDSGEVTAEESSFIAGAAVPKTAFNPPKRPTYLPLGAQTQMSTKESLKQKQSQILVSSPSITNDDVFFDISPNVRPPLSSVTSAAIGQHIDISAPSVDSIATEIDMIEKTDYNDRTLPKLTRMRSRSLDDHDLQPHSSGQITEAMIVQEKDAVITRVGRNIRGEIVKTRMDAGEDSATSLHGYPSLIRQNGYDLGDGENQLAVGSTQGGSSRFSVLQRRAVLFEQKQSEITKKGSLPRFRSWLSLPAWLSRSISGDRDGRANLKSLLKFKYSTRPTGATIRRPGAVRPAGESIKKRKRSMPIYGKFQTLDPDVARQLKDVSYDYRPFFTYWITTVQVIIMIFMLLQYGIGSDFSNGLGVIERSDAVMASSLSFVRIVVWEQNNIWIGPRFADLVHAGAKYSPCMRRDAKIYEQILQERREEADATGCCVGGHGCFQTSECPKQFATLIKWSNDTLLSPVSHSRNNAATSQMPSRVVCGQDPLYCKIPPSKHPFEWNQTDISKWPICKQSVPVSQIPKHVRHMHCEITGRPCCIQMHGQCRITTKAYCDFVRGYYHSNATLCSQVSCLNDVCGMTPFLTTDRPDQIYRLITPLFIHAGIIRCAITVALQMTIMRNFESMIGWLRLSIIYFVSGIGGYLASAIFVPYMPEVGPAGSQGGVLGALIVNVIYNWSFLLNPRRVLLYHLCVAVFLFLTGFMPYIDNWAQLFGFVIGCLLAAALIPYITIGPHTRHRRIILVVGSLGATIVLFAVLFGAFYAHPSTLNYDLLSLLNCPFSGKVCDHQSLILRSWLPI